MDIGLRFSHPAYQEFQAMNLLFKAEALDTTAMPMKKRCTSAR
jgi:hypothetical protein